MNVELERFRGAVDVTVQLGERLNKNYDQAKTEAERARGASEALMTFHSQKIPSIHKVFDQAVADGLIKLEGLNPLQIQSLVKEWVTKAGEAARNFGLQKKNEEMVHRGKVAGLEPAIMLVQNHHDVAVSRTRQIEQAEREKISQDEVPSTAKKATGRRSLAEASSGRKPTKKRSTKKRKKRSTKKS